MSFCVWSTGAWHDERLSHFDDIPKCDDKANVFEYLVWQLVVQALNDGFGQGLTELGGLETNHGTHFWQNEHAENAGCATYVFTIIHYVLQISTLGWLWMDHWLVSFRAKTAIQMSAKSGQPGQPSIQSPQGPALKVFSPVALPSERSVLWKKGKQKHAWCIKYRKLPKDLEFCSRSLLILDRIKNLGPNIL